MMKDIFTAVTMLIVTTTALAQNESTGSIETYSVQKAGQVAPTAKDLRQDNGRGKHRGDRPMRRHGRGHYVVVDGKVFCDGVQIKEASAHSFRVLGEGYACDNFRVYHNGRQLKSASAQSFASLGLGYARDNFRVYLRGKEIKGASAQSFQLLGDGYARDSFRVYYQGRQLKGASAQSFRVLGDGYARDSFRVYHRGKRVE